MFIWLQRIESKNQESNLKNNKKAPVFNIEG